MTLTDMVASGVPEPNRRHAVEIARMALNLVKACKTFVIPHFPGQKLKIRVGVHSGKNLYKENKVNISLGS